MKVFIQILDGNYDIFDLNLENNDARNWEVAS